MYLFILKIIYFESFYYFFLTIFDDYLFFHFVYSINLLQ